MGIVEFLEARIAEDEARVDAIHSLATERYGGLPVYRNVSGSPTRILREVAAKRELMAREAPSRCQGHPKPWMQHGEHGAGFCFAPSEDSVLYVLAAIYSDHPDFNEEWRP